jgi:HK97 family phage prohead protease
MADQRRRIFTTDARLTVARRPRRATFAAAAGAGGAAELVTTLVGYAIVWNVLSTDRGGYAVRLLPASARFTADVLALWNHDSGRVLGSTGNGTLRLVSDEIGVRVEIDLPDTTDGRDAAELVEGRYVRGMSFAWTSTPEAFPTTEAGRDVLNVKSFECDEVTVTAVPAFVQTTVDVTPAAAAAATPPAAEPEYSRTTAGQAARFGRNRLELLRLTGDAAAAAAD